jgi:hypothetical protein
LLIKLVCDRPHVHGFIVPIKNINPIQICEKINIVFSIFIGLVKKSCNFFFYTKVVICWRLICFGFY